MPKPPVILLAALALLAPTAAASLPLGLSATADAALGAAVSASKDGASASANASAHASAQADANAAKAAVLSKVARLPDPKSLTGPWTEVTIRKDFAGAEVSGTIPIRGTARAKEGFALDRVSITIDRRIVGYASGTQDWSFRLNSALLVDGPHEVQACATARVAALPALVSSGACSTLKLSTLNHAPSVTLFERAIDVDGAASETWAHVLDRDVTGLRMTFSYAPSPGAKVAPRALVLAGYESASGSLDGWVGTFGAVEGSASWTQRPDMVARHPGALFFAGEFAGQGRLTVRVEAVPVAS